MTATLEGGQLTGVFRDASDHSEAVIDLKLQK